MKRVVITLLAFALLLLSVFASETTVLTRTVDTSEAPQTVDTLEAPRTTNTSGAPRTTNASEAPRTETTFPFEELTYVKYKPGKSMSIVRTPATGPAPCVVILHGYTAQTSVYLPLAESVAEKDAVVFLPEFEDTLPSDEDPRTTTITNGLDDIADAMRFVRLYAERYGGDPERIVIVGHSLGAVFAMTTMLAGNQFGTDAFPHEVSALPDAYVSLDGVVPFRELLWDEGLRRLYDEDPATWGKIDPDTYLVDVGSRTGVEFRFFVATLDFGATQSMAERMRKLGYKTSVERIDVSHAQAAQPQPQTVQAIAELAHPD